MIGWARTNTRLAQTHGSPGRYRSVTNTLFLLFALLSLGSALLSRYLPAAIERSKSVARSFRDNSSFVCEAQLNWSGLELPTIGQSRTPSRCVKILPFVFIIQLTGNQSALLRICTRAPDALVSRSPRGQVKPDESTSTSTSLSSLSGRGSAREALACGQPVSRAHLCVVVVVVVTDRPAQAGRTTTSLW